MKKKKQILSVFLSLCMIISCMVGMSVTAGAVVSPSAAEPTSALSGDGDITIDNFYDDFVGVTKEEAKAWTGAPATGYSMLTYKIDGGKLFFVYFHDGTCYDTGDDVVSISTWNSALGQGGFLYYTTGSGSSTPTWSGEIPFTETATINSDVTVSADTTLTIAEGVTVTVNGTINAEGKTLTVAGKGALVVNGANGNKGDDGEPGENGENGGNGGDGGVGIAGNVIVNGATVTVTGGNGGNGGSGGNAYEDGGNGGNGGNGGFGIQGNLTVNSGSATVTGGNGGIGGIGGYGYNDGGVGGIDGNPGSAVSGTITGSAQESEDNSTWSAVSNTGSLARYVKITADSTPSLPSWTNGNVIGILDGTKLTVAKKDGAQNGDMGNEWTAEGTTEWDSVKETITELEIQDSVTSIGNGAFDDCLKLTSVTIPSSVTSIGNSAFSWCTALTSVTIPSSVTSIGHFAFYYCESLTSVTIPSSVTSIGNYAFSGCSKLASVTIPNSVTSIGFGSFQDCTSLTSVTIPDSVTSIDMNAFYRCSALTSVTIPSSVTRIGEEAFRECTSLTSVKFNPGTADATLSIGEAAFNDTANGAKVAYGTGDTVLYDGENEITTETLLTAIQDKILTWKESTYTITMKNGGTASVDGNTVTKAPKGATVEIVAPVAEPGTEFNGWTSTPKVTFADADSDKTTFTMPASNVDIYASFQNIAYKITMRNGGTAYVDGKKATTAEAGTVVTVKAGSSGTSARFNGWTTTTEGVEFADADSAETTFKMPMSDVEITASYESVKPYIPSYSSNTSTTTSSSTASSVDSASSAQPKMRVTQNDDNSLSVSWDKVNGASLYSLYVRKDGELKKVVDTKKTKVRINNPENNTTLEYVLKYTIGGVESAENKTYTATIKVYYKPAVKASSKDGAVILKWNKVEGAEKYRVYKFTNGKLVKIADTTANAVRLKNVIEGKTYKYAVKAYVDGKWTKVTSKDIVSVKVK